MSRLLLHLFAVIGSNQGLLSAFEAFVQGFTPLSQWTFCDVQWLLDNRQMSSKCPVSNRSITCWIDGGYSYRPRCPVGFFDNWTFAPLSRRGRYVSTTVQCPIKTGNTGSASWGSAGVWGADQSHGPLVGYICGFPSDSSGILVGWKQFANGDLNPDLGTAHG